MRSPQLTKCSAVIFLQPSFVKDASRSAFFASSKKQNRLFRAVHSLVCRKIVGQSMCYKWQLLSVVNNLNTRYVEIYADTLQISVKRCLKKPSWHFSFNLSKHCPILYWQSKVCLFSHLTWLMFLHYLTKSQNTEIASFHSNAICCFAKRHTKHI